MPRDRRRGLTTQSNVGKPISTQLLFVGSDTNRSLHATGCWSSCQDRPVEVEAHKWPLPDQLRKVWDNLITAAASGALQLLIGGIEARAVPRTNAVRLPTTPQGRRTRAIRFPPSGQRRLRRREATDADNSCSLISCRCARSSEGRNGLGCPSVSANNRVSHRRHRLRPRQRLRQRRRRFYSLSGGRATGITNWRQHKERRHVQASSYHRNRDCVEGRTPDQTNSRRRSRRLFHRTRQPADKAVS